MPNLIFKRSTPVRAAKDRLAGNTGRFSIWQLAVFMLAFAVIGYAIYHSFAVTTQSTSFPWNYKSPFGDQSSGTDPSTGNLINCGSAKSSLCYGSCYGTAGNTGSCRPWTTETCSGDTSPSLHPSALDQGADYDTLGGSGCTYNNPDRSDTGGLTAHNAATNTPVYAMGVGKVSCVAANPGYDESLLLTQHCPGSSRSYPVPIGHSSPDGSTPSGEGTWIVYKLTAGGSGYPARGRKIYIAEGCNLSRNAINNVTAAGGRGNASGDRFLGRRWKVGDIVTPNSILCEIHHGNSTSNPGTIEMGWANEGLQHAGGAPFRNEIEPAAYSCFNNGPNSVQAKHGYAPTVWGHSFNEFVEDSTPANINMTVSADNHIAKRNGQIVSDNSYHQCPTTYPMPAKYKGVWYNPNHTT